MKPNSLVFAVLALVSMGSATSVAQRHSLLPHLRVGDVFKYQFKGTYAAADKESIYTASFEMAIGAIARNGELTFKNKQVGGEISQGGQVRKLPESATTSILKPNGEIVSVDPPYASPEQARFSRLMQIIVSDKPVKVGDIWTWSQEPSTVNGNIGYDGKVECVAFETRGGAGCARIRLTGKERSGLKPATGTMEVWVNLKDGLPMEMSMVFTDVPLAPGLTATYRAENKRIGS